MKKLFILLLLPLCTWAQLELNLESSIQKAIQTHPDFQESVLISEAANTAIDVAKASRLPRVEAGIFQSANFGRSIDRFTNAFVNEVYNATFAQASLSMPLFQGFRIQNTVAQNQSLRDASILSMQTAKNQLTAQVIQSYLEVLTAKELLVTAQKQVEATKNQMAFLDKQMTAGTLGKSDYLQLETQLGQDQFAAIAAENSVIQAESLFKQLTGVPLDEEISLVGLESELNAQFTLQEAFSEASINAPQLAAIAKRKESMTYEIKAIRSSSLPQLDFFANWNTLYASTNPEQEFFEQLNATRNGSLVLGLTIPIFENFRNKPQIQAVKVRQLQEQNNFQRQKLLLRRQVENAYISYSNAKNLLENAEMQLATADENLKVQEKLFRAGTQGPVNYILAQQNFTQAQASYITAKYQKQFQYEILSMLMKGV